MIEGIDELDNAVSETISVAESVALKLSYVSDPETGWS